jgi:hypothetical protein
MEYIDIVLDLVQEINLNSKIEVINDQYGYNDPLPIKQIAATLKQYQVQLSPHISTFYESVDGGISHWRLTTGDTVEEVRGVFKLIDLKTMLGGERHAPLWADILWFDFMDDQTRAERQKLRPFDFFDRSGGRCICFVLDNNVLKDDLVYYDLNKGIFPIHLDLPAYMDLLVKTRGFYPWQEFFIDPTNKVVQGLHQHIPKIFGNTDLSFFK